MPNWLAQQIQDMYAMFIENRLPVNMNPMQKIPFVVTGHEGEVYMDEIPGNDGENGAGTNQEDGGPNNGGATTNVISGTFVDHPL